MLINGKWFVGLDERFNNGYVIKKRQIMNKLRDEARAKELNSSASLDDVMDWNTVKEVSVKPVTKKRNTNKKEVISKDLQKIPS